MLQEDTNNPGLTALQANVTLQDPDPEEKTGSQCNEASDSEEDLPALPDPDPEEKPAAQCDEVSSSDG